jgi:hypothetical protein
MLVVFSPLLNNRATMAVLLKIALMGRVIAWQENSRWDNSYLFQRFGNILLCNDHLPTFNCFTFHAAGWQPGQRTDISG